MRMTGFSALLALTGCASCAGTGPASAPRSDCPHVGGWQGTQGTVTDPAAQTLRLSIRPDGNGSAVLISSEGELRETVRLTACADAAFSLSREREDGTSYVSDFANDGPDTFRSTRNTAPDGRRQLIVIRR